jgi:hypothetical protein
MPSTPLAALERHRCAAQDHDDLMNLDRRHLIHPVDVGQSTCAVLITINTYSIRNVAVTATKKSQATIALAWFFRKVDQR